jgi:hypothetical protein
MLLRSLLVAVLLATSTAMACELTAPQVQEEALAFLQKEYPTQQFRRGKSIDVIVLGEAEFGLQNLRSKLCLSNPQQSAKARQDAMRAHFQAMMLRLKEREPKVPSTWAEAKERLFPQFMPSEYLRLISQTRAVVTRSFIPGVELAVVQDRKESYEYVREEDRTRWSVDQKQLFSVAIENLAKKKSSIKLQVGDGADRFLAIEEKDGYDAVSILVPWVRQEAVKFLGDPFLIAVPNRDFLVMWSTKNGSGFQSFARSKAQKDFTAQPYPLSPAALRVWSDGRIEVAP